MNRIKTILLSTIVSLTAFSACNNAESNNKKSSDMNTHHHEHSGNKEKVEVKIASEPQVIEAGKPTNLSISILENGKSVALEIVHEMKMHLLVVNEELTWFDHIHPEEQADGTYTITETFPSAGKYLLFTDYKPTGGNADVNKQVIEVGGSAVAQNTELKTKLVSTVDGYTVTLLNGEDFKTNRGQGLQFSVEKDGKQLEENDMQNYLGATAHIVMISKADNDFLHIHPVSDSRFPIYAETHIEKAGLYRMWVQFKLNEVVHTADFTITVAEGEKSADDHSHHHHH